MWITGLPEECLSHAISLTSPRDACCASTVSGMFRGAADSDLTWAKFLPSDYREIISRSVVPVEYSSNKELFAKLSTTPLLIDGGKKTFSLDKITNKKCYMLSARELAITWSTNSFCWRLKRFPDSRFSEAIELILVCRLEIQGKVNTRALTPNTTYGAYLVVQISDRAFGLNAVPSEVSIEVGDYKTRGELRMNHDELDARSELGEERTLRERGDGWTEVELGEFYNVGDEKQVVMEFRQVKSEVLKAGLIVEGIELRPKLFSTTLVIPGNKNGK